MEPEENRTGRRWNLPLILLLILAATALFSAGTGRRTGSGIANTESKNAEQAANVGNEADDSSLRSDAEAVNSYGDIYWMPPESGAGEASVPKEEVAQTVKTAEPETEKTIRVKICASDYEEALHDRIQITSSGTYSLQWSGGEEVYPGDQILTIDPEDDRLKNGKMTVAAENGLQLVKCTQGVRLSGLSGQYRDLAGGWEACCDQQGGSGGISEAGCAGGDAPVLWHGGVKGAGDMCEKLCLEQAFRGRSGPGLRSKCGR